MNRKFFKNPVKKQRIQNVSPALFIVGSFFLVIAVGTGLLMLPVCSQSGEATGFLDALFTATSATCVTGLVVVDTAVHYSLLGQIVILMLIQIGGLGLITITAFFVTLIRRKTTLKNMVITQESISSENNLGGIRPLLKLIISFSFITELIGALILSIRFIPDFGPSGIWKSIFISISAFCNAGFDILGTADSQYINLVGYQSDPLVLITVMALIVIGGLGFIVYYDLIVNRPKQHKLMLHTKLVLTVTALLIISGTIIFMLFEWGNSKTIGDMSFGDKLLNSAFYSVTLRTAGFNSFDLAALTDPSKLISCIYMFIGAAPGSTGGGIKVTAFVVIMFTVIYTIKNSGEEVIIGRRSINQKTVNRAFTIAILGFAMTFLTALITYLESDISVMDAAYESFSAFATVGVATINTGALGVISKIMLVLTMFFGRVGPVSFFLALSVKQGRRKKREVLPDGQIIVG